MAPESKPLPYKTLFEIPGFAGLRDVTNTFGIELTVHGGFVRRLMTVFRKSETEQRYPEEVAFFSSDIDVIHSGTMTQTPGITEAVISAIPFGESIRWQVKSSEENAVFESAMPFNGIVPANLMSITTSQNWGVRDEWHGQVDIRGRKYRYIRNGFYKKSPLYQAGRDLEVFSALLYFKVLVDDLIVGADLEKQPGLNDAKTVIHSACSSSLMLGSLQESAYLRARFLYLIKDIRALALSSSDWKHQVEAFGLDRLVEYLQEDAMFNLGKQVGELVQQKRTVTISARLAGDQYRLEESEESWQFNDNAAKQLEETFARYSNSIVEKQEPELGDGQRVVCSSPSLSINQGRSSSSQSGESTHEFFHFAVPISVKQDKSWLASGNSEFAVLVELSSSLRQSNIGKPVILSVPSVCTVVARENEGMMYVRVNAFGFLENSPALTRTPAEETVG